MRHLFLLAIIFVTMSGCLKPDEEFSGQVHVSGRVIDRETGKPLPGALIALNEITQKQGPIGYSGFDEIVAVDTSDAAGNYSFSYKANRATALTVLLLDSRTHLQYLTPGGEDNVVSGIGDYVRDVNCVKIAYAGFELHNTPPRSAANISLSSPVDGRTLLQQLRDTTVYLKIYGDNRTTNTIVFAAGDAERQYRDITAPGNDTVIVRFEF